jgi:hypothetical protein
LFLALISTWGLRSPLKQHTGDWLLQRGSPLLAVTSLWTLPQCATSCTVRVWLPGIRFVQRPNLKLKGKRSDNTWKFNKNSKRHYKRLQNRGSQSTPSSCCSATTSKDTLLLLLPPLHFGSFLTASLSWFWFRAVLCRCLVLYACTVCLVTRLFAGWLGSSPYLDWLCSPSRVLTVRSISQCQKLTAHPRLVLTLMRGAVVYLHFPIHLHEVMLSWVPGKQLLC